MTACRVGGRLLAGLLAACACSGAAAQGIYRYTAPDGRVIYTDDPPAGQGGVRQVETPPSPATAGKPPAGLSEGEKRLLEQQNRRLAELDRATADIVAAFQALRAAEARLEQGAEPTEGERGGRRYRPEYWMRQQALRSDVETARARLNEALTRRNALR